MTRKITIAGQKLEVSKNEAKEASRIASMRVSPFNVELAQRACDDWLRTATPEARKRRIACIKAMKLNAPDA